MTRDTLRRRRGASSNNATSTGVTATASPSGNGSATASRGVNASAAPSANNGAEQTPKTVEQVLKEEEASFSNFLKLSALLVFVFFYMIRTTALPPNRRVYAVIVDAGSTGTRAQIFEFVHNLTTDRLELRGTKMHSIKKSIAALGTGVGGTGNQFFKPLIESVKKGVPGIRRRRRTPIKLGATAGLRLLGEDAAELALHHARKALNSTDFLFHEDYVSIMDSRDEAKHGWTTVNYLLGRIGPEATEPPVATLELGGGSTQFVHPATSTDELDKEDGVSHLVSVDVLGESHQVMASSHLGLGLLSFTKMLYTSFETEGVLIEGNPCFRLGKTFKDKMLKLGGEGSEETRRVTIIGDGDFDRCVASSEIVIAHAVEKGDTIPPLPKDTVAYAFAFFYDRTVGYGMSAEPTKEEFLRKGKQLCEEPESARSPGQLSKQDEDGACAEFSYVYALIKLLTSDFSPEHNVKVRFEQYVDGHMLGWALGAALDAVEPTIHHQIAVDDEPLTIS